MQLEGTLGKSIVPEGEGQQTGSSSVTKSLGEDEFLKLLIVKLQNQDPLNPQDDLEFIGQLAQFSGLEQLVDVNANLVALQEQQNELSNVRLLSFLGKEVVVSDDTFTVEDGIAPRIGYELPTAATELVVSILDESGKAVRVITDAPRTPGEHEIDFDGCDAEGNPLADGAYRVRVGAIDVDGEVIMVSAYFCAEVTGIRMGEDGTVRLLLGDQEVDLCDVRTVLQPSQASELLAEAEGAELQAELVPPLQGG